MPLQAERYAGWLGGLALLSLIFLANARGWTDQTRAARELANFLKNVSLFGGLLVAASWRGAP